MDRLYAGRALEEKARGPMRQRLKKPPLQGIWQMRLSSAQQLIDYARKK